MTVRLAVEKKQVILELCKLVLNTKKIKIRIVAKLLGKFTSSFIGVKFGRLHYRYFDNDKTKALRISKGNYEATMSLSDDGMDDIRWWIDNIMESYNDIEIGNRSLTHHHNRCF